MNQELKAILEKANSNSISYERYHEIVKELVEQKKSSGPNQEEAFIHYTKLNDHRAKRLDKTAKLTDEFLKILDGINNRQTWLLITESWCGDAVQALPFFNKAAMENSNINLRLVFRDEHVDLIDSFLTNGGRSIPKLIIIEDDKVIADWGPRPKPAQELYMDFRNYPKGRVYEDVQIDLQKWYLKDKGITMQNEIVTLLEKKR
ncbi:MAG: thiol-disulfide isomerase/thioredoxin [Flavobacteriales bacterium]|jgi:thiol-disulfide isomerase/thioredoxin